MVCQLWFDLDRDRFLCYIQGGKPKGSQNTYTGCRNTTPPIKESPIILNHELYFAKFSRNWNGGVGFIKCNSDKAISTYGYMYLITKDQFCDVLKQEIQSLTNITLDFESSIKTGNLIFNRASWYGNILHIGSEGGFPIFTFTHTIDINETTKPSQAYLKMIISGLVKVHSLSIGQIVDFLLPKLGVSGNYSREELKAIFEDWVQSKDNLEDEENR